MVQNQFKGVENKTEATINRSRDLQPWCFGKIASNFFVWFKFAQSYGRSIRGPPLRGLLHVVREIRFWQCWAPQVFFLSPQIRNRISIFLIRNRKSAIAHLKAYSATASP